MNEEISFTISMKYGALKIENNSKEVVEVLQLPEGNKRKLNLVLTVRPGSFLLREQANIDLSKLCFRLVPRKNT